ncbi:VanZ family protein [Fictibacillus barbaricus]|uniref:Glycopeptide antibiotics resistance protein n=1 Tax=Fictibacillus barbaricus TaxID=182136 RepID=A0ABU1TWH2_9BACL|nr:VanZ family protein [Fictibacillus barbaricus]MDR7071562.1 glycopeptide antibiotics resistance protein [Fictibacillus barbaricus]
MNTFKKLLTLFPVLFISLNFIRSRYRWEFNDLGIFGFVEIALNVLPILFFASWDVFRRPLKLSAAKLLIMSSFYFYSMVVFYLTIFSVPFRNFFLPFQWSDVLEDKSYYLQTISLIPFKTIIEYGLVNTQVIGNLIMLMPLGIYISVLYKKSVVNGMITLLTIAFGIEFLQFLFSVIIPSPLHSLSYGRSTDIDDVLLNFSGAAFSFTICRWVIQKYTAPFQVRLKKTS